MIMRKIAFLSNVNIDLIQPIFNKLGEYESYFSGFNQWQSEMMNTNSSLHHFSPDFVFLFLLDDNKKIDFDNDIQSVVDFFVQHHPKCQIIISDSINKPFQVSTFIKSHQIEDFDIKLARYEQTCNNVHLFKFSRLLNLYGYKNIFDDKFWYLGKIKLSQPGFKWLSSELHHFLNALTGKSKKVLVLDLDNTLWGDIVGEVGWNNIVLSNENKGLIFKDFQQSVAQLKSLGVLLAIVSKNNLQDVKEVFEHHTDMVLEFDDFVSHQINWKHKSENIQQLALDLNLGLDAFVFIDDNPREREEVKQELPEVVVPDFPDDITQLNFWFINEVVYPYFAKMFVSEEDKAKTAQYMRETKRTEQKKALNFDEYIISLQIQTDIRLAQKNDLPRIFQLINKTNQFNVHPVRLTEAELNVKYEDPQHRIYILKYADKFGVEGLTACAIVRIENENPVFEHFLLSCRILGRRVESTFLKAILEDIKPLEKVTFEYEETSKNSQVRSFLSEDKFKQTNQNTFIKYL